MELILVSWHDISHEPGGRLLLHSTTLVATFPAKEINQLGQHQIILHGDTGTQV